MPPKVTFCGAAGTVTGSCYLIEQDGHQLLVDCGMFQGSKTLRELNYGRFPFEPRSIDAVLLTHAHIDHSGLIPKLCRHGYTGPIYATDGTRDLLTYMLPDSGYIQESEVKFLNSRNRRRGRPAVEPIYTRADAEASLDQIEVVEIGDWFEPVPGLRARYWHAGHILGAASIELTLPDGDHNDSSVTMLFSGDIGPEHKAFEGDPHAPDHVDYLCVESTYGNRDRADRSPAARRAVLKKEVTDALEAGGNLIIPAFAVERTQELLYDLSALMAAKELPSVPVYLDSPLAIEATEVFERHADTLEGVRRGKSPFRRRNIRFVHSAEESMALAPITSGIIIIAAAGMCEAGRVRHHLKNNLWRPQATVLLVGYQAPATLGDLLSRGVSPVRIHGEEIEVRARIRKIDIYSAHADRTELIEWVKDRLPVKQGIFLTHGEPESLSALRQGLIDIGCRPARLFIPRLDESFELVARGKPRAHLAAPRLEPKTVAAATDWHNEYARLAAELPGVLRRLPSNAARNRLLKRLTQALDAAESGLGKKKG